MQFMPNKIYPFSLPFDQFNIRGDHYEGSADTGVLLLHGAGTSDRSRFSILRPALLERGIGSTAFDCIGHGETGGDMAQSSLASRTRQAQAVIAGRKLSEPLVIAGASMGAYNAIKLTQLKTVSTLILTVPGVFTPAAYEVPFGPQFSSVIRRERSWAESDAWDILAEFTGSLLVIAAEHDAVIPREIPERLVESAIKSRWRKLLVVRGAEHKHLFSLLLEQPEQFKATIDLVVEGIEAAKMPAAIA